MVRLYIFDVDGTLAEKWSDEILPGVREWFETMGLHADGAGTPFERPGDVRVAFATNQGGVGMREIREREGKEGSQYPTAKQVIERLENLSEQLTGDRHGAMAVVAFNYPNRRTGLWAVDYDAAEHHVSWDPDFRKPEPGMLRYIMETLEVAPEDTVMVGDRDDDRLAARAAGVSFVDADEFFGRNK